MTKIRASGHARSGEYERIIIFVCVTVIMNYMDLPSILHSAEAHASARLAPVLTSAW
jgi:hypothetical protein